MIKIWTDGACKGNPGPGGWGALIEQNGVRIKHSGGDPDTTNNIMELTACIEAIKMTPIESSIEIVSDSQYVVKGMTEWIVNWLKNDWKTSKGAPVKNVEHWKRLHELCSNRKVVWKWVRGHDGHEENEIVDKLAVEASNKAAR